MGYYRSSFRVNGTGEADYFDDAFCDYAVERTALCSEMCEDDAAAFYAELESGALRLPAVHRSST